MVVIHNGGVWAYKISCGWFLYLKAFPQAFKKIGKDDFIPDVNHQSVLDYTKDKS